MRLQPFCFCPRFLASGSESSVSVMMAEREARVISDENTVTVTIIIRVTVITAETNTESGMSRDGADASLVRGKS